MAGRDSVTVFVVSSHSDVVATREKYLCSKIRNVWSDASSANISC